MAEKKVNLLEAYKSDRLKAWGDLDQGIAIYEAVDLMEEEKPKAKKTTSKKKTKK